MVTIFDVFKKDYRVDIAYQTLISNNIEVFKLKNLSNSISDKINALKSNNVKVVYHLSVK